MFGRHRVLRCAVGRVGSATAQTLTAPAAISLTPSWPAATATRPAMTTAGRRQPGPFRGGLKFTTPAFIATAPNITPDVEPGIAESWSDAEIKRALVEGCAGSRPPRRRAAGRDHAGQFHTGAAARIISMPSSPIFDTVRAGPHQSPRSRLQGAGAPTTAIPTPRPEIRSPMFADPVRRAPISSPSAMHGCTPPGRAASDYTEWIWPAAAGCFRRRDRRSGGNAASVAATHHVRSGRPGSAAGSDQEMAAPSPMELRATDRR